MKGVGSYAMPAVQEAFLDPERLRQALQGCEKLEKVGEDEYKATVRFVQPRRTVSDHAGAADRARVSARPVGPLTRPLSPRVETPLWERAPGVPGVARNA
jgi:hypothetical protein